MVNRIQMSSGKPISIPNLKLSKDLRLLVLGPHPDDFDVVGVTLRYFMERGNPIFVGVATSGASGVEDSFCSPPSWDLKTFLREREQIASCQYFGLPEKNLTFLRLEEDADGHPIKNTANRTQLQTYFHQIQPEIVFLPYGNDTNPGHQRIYDMFSEITSQVEYPLVAFLNRDPKTIALRHDVYMGYDETVAKWKSELLRFHKSQQQRNLNHRSYGFDERILQMDMENAYLCSLDLPYAELFEVEFFGSDSPDDFLDRTARDEV